MPAVAHALVDDGAVRTRCPLQPGRHPSTQVVEAHGMALPDSPNLGDVLINVAGGDTNHGTFEETTDEVWVSMIELNLLGVVRCCRAAIPYLRRSDKNPAIVNVSSVNSLAALGSEPYSSAKAGISALTINLAASLAADGIRVKHCRSSHDQDSKLGGTTGRSRSLPPSLPARTGPGT
jgi:NAD(P)-dependent dehydrogenase (short-subunit alcohol dehydrogenase family)